MNLIYIHNTVQNAIARHSFYSGQLLSTVLMLHCPQSMLLKACEKACEGFWRLHKPCEGFTSLVKGFTSLVKGFWRLGKSWSLRPLVLSDRDVMGDKSSSSLSCFTTANPLTNALAFCTLLWIQIRSIFCLW